jgi:hypothetical protein
MQVRGDVTFYSPFRYSALDVLLQPHAVPQCYFKDIRKVIIDEVRVMVWQYTLLPASIRERCYYTKRQNYVGAVNDHSEQGTDCCSTDTHSICVAKTANVCYANMHRPHGQPVCHISVRAYVWMQAGPLPCFLPPTLLACYPIWQNYISIVQIRSSLTTCSQFLTAPVYVVSHTAVIHICVNYCHVTTTQLETFVDSYLTLTRWHYPRGTVANVGIQW